MADRDKDSQFPATSIGRTAGARLQHSSVHESHPLGMNLATSDIPSITGSNTLPAHKYKPYTPRTRVVPATTTNTLVHPPSPQPLSPAGGGDATSKLQLTKAKSEAQNIGLDTSSVGWGILEKVVVESETGELWAEIWSLATSGKATLLLPAEHLAAQERLTPEFLKDHIVFCDPIYKGTVPLVTLSGLRGTLSGTNITFSSSLHPSSPAFRSLQDPTTRSSALRNLPPLPSISHPGYPQLKVLNGSTTLPLPPRAPVPPKPPLPPRPGARHTTTTSHASSVSSSSSRIPNPFASLFGGGQRSSTPTTPAPALPQLPVPAAHSPSTSIQSLESMAGDTAHTVVEVTVIVIDKKVDRKDIAKTMNKVLSKEIKGMLSSTSGGGGDEVPKWVTQRVIEFCEPWFPFVRAPKVMSSMHTQSGLGDWNVNSDGVNDEGMIDDKVDFMQEFYLQLEEGLRVELGGGSNGKNEKEKETYGVEGENENDGGKVKEKVKKESEMKIRYIMELVERTICSLFYDRLYTQPETDDMQHDTALSNRVAALNLLDLTLEHLDIEVGQASATKVDSVVKLCGQRLCELGTVRAPRDKARILVEAHQVVVDGLSKLPPIRLMSAEESKALREQQQQQAAEKKTKENLDTPSVAERGQISLIIPPAATTTTTTEPALLAPDGPSAPTTSTSLVTAEIGAGQQAELSPLSFNTTETLSSVSPLPSRPSSPLPEPTPVSSDVLLPMIIFSVVKSNPPHLVSNLLYTQRFRNQNAYMHEGNGEESFCLINMLAVAEFLENVDLEALGLGSSTGVSAAELSPIITRSPTTPIASLPISASLTPKTSGQPLLAAIDLRGKVEQQVDAIAGSANKVISGVVDSSFGILRSFLPHPTDGINHNNTNNSVGQDVVETPTTAKPGSQGFGLLRRDSVGVGFSIASIISSSRAKAQGEEGQQLMAVSSRPGSVKSSRSGKSMRAGEKDAEDDEEDDEGSGREDEDEEDGEEGSEEEEEEEGSDVGMSEGEDSEDDEGKGMDIPGIQVGESPYITAGDGANASASASSFGTDARSIRSFESMLSDSKRRQKVRQKVKKANAKEGVKVKKAEEKKGRGGVGVQRSSSTGAPRKSLSDRLASVSALAGGLKGSPPDSRRSSLLQPPIIAPIPVPARAISGSVFHTRHGASPSSSRIASPILSRSPSPLLTARATMSSPLPLLPALPVDSTRRLPLPPPNQRFMGCASADELRISEVRELLDEYRRLVEGVKAFGGYE